MTDKLTVSVELGAVMPLSEKGFGNIKPLIKIDGLDPSGDVETQISLALSAATAMWVAIDKHMEIAVSNLIGGALGTKGVTDRVTEVEEILSNTLRNMETMRSNNKLMVDKIKEQTNLISELSKAVRG